MAIKEMDSGSYKLEVFYPKEVREILGITNQRFRKTYSTEAEAKKAEDEIKKKIEQVKKEKQANAFELKGNIKFKDFYKQVWLDMYCSGSTGISRKVPSQQTIYDTKKIFSLHVLPIFGEYSLLELNNNKDFVLQKLNLKSKTYANIKILKGYFNQVFDIAELFDYIEHNRIEKIIRYVGEPLKLQLKRERELKGESLTAEELLAWIEAVQEDTQKGYLSFKDFVLFTLTLNLGDRKSESYALQWKHIDLEGKTITLVQSKTRNGSIVQTKGRKNTKFHLPDSLINLLSEWKKKQANELQEIGLKQTEEQFLFTSTNRKGKLNVPVYMEYLNYKISAVRRRHKKLTHATPHKLRHTFSTLAYEGGATLEEISRALTHSDIKTTQIYVNTPNVVDLSAYNKFEKRLREVQN